MPLCWNEGIQPFIKTEPKKAEKKKAETKDRLKEQQPKTEGREKTKAKKETAERIRGL